MKFAVQLYSVRDHIKTAEDLLEVLGKVKEIGFDGVEFAGTFGVNANKLKARLDELELTAVGAHLGLDDFIDENIEKTLEYYKTLGCKTIGIGGAPHETMEEIENIRKILGAASERAAKDGMKIYYHNHTEEFDKIEGKERMDWIKEACYIEVDTYWSFVAGVDNYKYITENKDRIAQIHIKDGINRKPKTLGEGENDLKAVIKATKEIGLEWIILENDDPVPTGLEDITRGIKYLKSNA